MKEKKENRIALITALSFIALMVCFFFNPEASIGAVDDSTIGKPATITGTVAVTTVTSVTNVAAGQVQTDAMATGYVGSQSVTVGTATAARIGTLTAGTKVVRIIPAADVNYGGVWLGTGTGYAVMTATGAPYDFKVATTTPLFYLMGNAASVAVLIEHIK